MKKVKTVLFSLLIVLVSSFLSACSCSEDSTVLETSISIDCVTEGITSSKDSNGLLTIECNRGDEFSIKYTLSPENTTSTQVDWSFEPVGVVSSSVTSKSATREETIVFKADKKGTTKINFVTAGAGKKATANVIVYPALADLPQFSTIDKIFYDVETSTIEWDSVSRLVYYNGNNVVKSEPVVVDETSETGIQGLSHYEVIITNKETGASTTQITTTNSLANAIDAGIKYEIKVVAVGDKKVARSSEESEKFNMYQIKTPYNFKRNEGSASFTYTIPANASKIIFTSYKTESEQNLNHPETNTKTVSITAPSIDTEETFGLDILPCYERHKDNKGNPYDLLHNLSISVQATYSTDDSNILCKVVNENGEDMHYYASKPMTEEERISIVRLSKPTIAMKDEIGSVTVGGVQFASAKLGTILTWSGEDYDGKFEAKYYYRIYKKISSNEIDIVSLSEGSAKQQSLRSLNLDAGEYFIDVVRKGNPDISFESETQTLSFTVLQKPTLNLITDDNTGASNLKIAGGTVGGIKAVELYCIGNNPANSKRIEARVHTADVTTDDSNIYYNLENAGLVNDTYTVYARLTGFNGATTDIYPITTATGVVTDSGVTFNIRNSVTSPQMTSNGIISFIDTENTGMYRVTVFTSQGGYSPTSSQVVYVGNGVEKDKDKNYVNLSKDTETIVDGGNTTYKYFVSLYDILNLHQEKTNDADIKNLVTTNLDYSFDVVAMSIPNSQGGESITSIPSIPTSEVHFIRPLPPDGSEFTLFNEKLYFVAPDRTSGYILSASDGNQTYTQTYLTKDLETIEEEKDDTTIVRTIIDLSTNPELLEALRTSTATNPSISIETIGSTSEVNVPGKLNSSSGTVYFNKTVAPELITIGVDENGILSWIPYGYTSEHDSSDFVYSNITYTLLVTVYGKTAGGEVDKSTILSTSEIKGIRPVYDEGWTFNYSLGELVPNDSFVGIKLIEVDSSKFTGVPSEEFIVSRVAGTDVSLYNENKFIQWPYNESDNRDYSATLYSVSVVNGKKVYTEVSPISSTSIKQDVIGIRYLAIPTQVNGENLISGTYAVGVKFSQKKNSGASNGANKILSSNNSYYEYVINNQSVTPARVSTKAVGDPAQFAVAWENSGVLVLDETKYLAVVYKKGESVANVNSALTVIPNENIFYVLPDGDHNLPVGIYTVRIEPDCNDAAIVYTLDSGHLTISTYTGKPISIDFEVKEEIITVDSQNVILETIITEGGVQQVILSWLPVEGATDYEVTYTLKENNELEPVNEDDDGLEDDTLGDGTDGDDNGTDSGEDNGDGGEEILPEPEEPELVTFDIQEVQNGDDVVKYYVILSSKIDAGVYNFSISATIDIDRTFLADSSIITTYAGGEANKEITLTHNGAKVEALNVEKLTDEGLMEDQTIKASWSHITYVNEDDQNLELAVDYKVILDMGTEAEMDISSLAQVEDSTMEYTSNRYILIPDSITVGEHTITIIPVLPNNNDFHNKIKAEFLANTVMFDRARAEATTYTFVVVEEYKIVEVEFVPLNQIIDGQYYSSKITWTAVEGEKSADDYEVTLYYKASPTDEAETAETLTYTYDSANYCYFAYIPDNLPVSNYRAVVSTYGNVMITRSLTNQTATSPLIITRYEGAESESLSITIESRNVSVGQVEKDIIGGEASIKWKNIFDEHTNLWNGENSKFYVGYIAKVETASITDGVISWSEGTDITVINGENNDNTEEVKSVGLNGLGEGTYRITIYPITDGWTREASAVGGVNKIKIAKPHAGAEQQVIINVYSSDLNPIFDYDNQVIEWENKHDSLTYDLYYSTASDTKTIIDLTTTTDRKVANHTTYTYSPGDDFVQGTSTIFAVIPRTNFVTSGVILLPLSTNTEKTPNSLTENLYRNSTPILIDSGLTENGKFVFYAVEEYTETTTINILVNGSREDKITREYITANASTEITDAYENYKYKYIVDLSDIGVVGEFKIDVSVNNTNTLNGYRSTQKTLQRVSSVTDFIKTDIYTGEEPNLVKNDYLTWTHLSGVDTYNISYVLDVCWCKDSANPDADPEVKYDCKHVLATIIVEGQNLYILTDQGEKTLAGLELKDGVIYYPLDLATIYQGDSKGDAVFSITTATNQSGWISNNNESNSQALVSKLNTGTIAVSNGNILIAGYDANNSESQQSPTSLEVEIYRVDDSNNKVQDEETTLTYSDALSDNITIDLNAMINGASLTKNGKYYVSIKYIGTNNILDSNKVETYLTKLENPIIRINDGEIVWNEISLGTGGDIDTVEEDEEEPITPSGFYADYMINIFNDNTKLEENITIIKKTTLADGQDADSDYYFTANIIYKLKIQALGGEQYLNSKVTDAYTVRKLMNPDKLSVHTISGNMNVDKLIFNETTQKYEIVTNTNEVDEHKIKGSPTLTWENSNAVNGLALRYEIFDGENKFTTPTGMIFKQNGTSAGYEKMYYALSTDKEIGSYSYQVRILGTSNVYSDLGGSSSVGLLKSDYSSVATINYIQDVQAVKTKDGRLSWNTISDAYGYDVIIQKDGEYLMTASIETNNLTTQEYNLDSVASLINGYFDVYVKAKITADFGIVSTHENTPVDNHLNVFRPNEVNNYKVLNGNLSWTYSHEDIVTFVKKNMDSIKTLLSESGDFGALVALINSPEAMADIIKQYVQLKINSDSYSGITEFNNAISFLLRFRMNINGVVMIDTPTSVELIDGDLVYSYNVSVARLTEANFPTTPETGDDTGSENGGSDTSEPVYVSGNVENLNPYGTMIIAVSTAGNHSVDTISIIDGKYTAETIEAYKPMTPSTWLPSGNDIFNGNILWTLVSDVTNTKYMDSYMIMAREVTNKNKMSYQNVRLMEDGSLLLIDKYGNPIYSDAEKFTDANGNGRYDEGESYIDKNENDSYDAGSVLAYVLKHEGEKAKVSENYKAFASAEALFTLATNKYNSVINNYEYQVCVRVNGTLDSKAVGFTGQVYLNSEEIAFNQVLDLLGAKNTQVSSGVYNYAQGEGSSMTRVYVFGPTENISITYDRGDGVKESVAIDWEKVVEVYQQEVIADTYFTMSESKLNTYKRELWNNAILWLDSSWNNVLKGEGVTFGWDTVRSQFISHLTIEDITKDIEDPENPEVVTQETLYTLTDHGNFPVGTYRLFSQDIGNGYGVVNAPFTRVITATKLDKTTRSDKEWLGSGINRGRFVWAPVENANVYKIVIQKRKLADGSLTLYEDGMGNVATFYTTNTFFDLPSVSALNDPNFEYGLIISAMKVSQDAYNDIYFGTDGITESTIKIITDQKEYNSNIVANTFVGDGMETEFYQRLAIPTGTQLKSEGSNGIYSWSYNDEGASGYYVKYNNSTTYIEEVLDEDKYLNDYDENYTKDKSTILSTAQKNVTGVISVQVRAIVSDYNSIKPEDTKYFINSSYSNALQAVQRTTPVPYVQNGILTWGSAMTGGEVETNSNLNIDGGEDIDVADISYKYYTEINGENWSTYNVDTDETLYSVSDHHFEVYFKGSEGVVTDPDTKFYIASASEEYNATKLPAPDVHYVTLDGQNVVNRVQWLKIDNATGYIVKVVLTDIIDPATGLPTVVGYQTTNDGTDDYFKHGTMTVKEGDTSLEKDCYIFELSALQENPLYKNSLYMRVFVQAVGSSISPEDKTEEINAYINSSYDYVDVIVPPMSANITFDNNTGMLTWDYEGVDNVDTLTSPYNVVLKSMYKVTNISPNDYNNYWKNSADQLASWRTNDRTGNVEVFNYRDNTRSITPYKEITYRVVASVSNENTPTNYDLYVVDTIVLEASKLNVKAPTSYQLTSMGTDYSFTLQTILPKSIGEVEGVTVSPAVEFTPEHNEQKDDRDFMPFSLGDGSEYYPYEIRSKENLDKLANFTTREFKFADGTVISYNENVWTQIPNFSGKINGNGATIENIKLNNDNMSMFRVLDGTIENLNIEIVFEERNAYYERNFEIAGIAYVNNGTINGVNIIEGSKFIIDNTYDGCTGLHRVAGIAITNYGTIINSSITNTVITSMSASESISVAGGIAIYNRGVIEGCNISGGTIQANYIGGIATFNGGMEELGNNDYAYFEGIISGCSVETSLIVSDKGSSSLYAGIQVGGISAQAFPSSVITDCYVDIEVSLTDVKGSTNTKSLGGIVATAQNGNSNVGTGITTIVNNIVNINTGSSAPSITFSYIVARPGAGDNIAISGNKCYCETRLTVTVYNDHGTTEDEHIAKPNA